MQTNRLSSPCSKLQQSNLLRNHPTMSLTTAFPSRCSVLCFNNTSHTQSRLCTSNHGSVFCGLRSHSTAMSALLRHRLQFNTGEFVNNHRQRLGLRHASSEESSSTSSTTPDDPSTPSSSTSPSGTNNNNKESSTSSSDNAELERRPNKNRPQKQQKGI